MKVIHRPLLELLAFGGVLLSACGGGGGGGGASKFTIVEASNGFGRLLPHQIAVRDANGAPTENIIEITRIEQLVDNATDLNPILPPTRWPTDPILPSDDLGNHFIYARFSQVIDVDSVLAPSVSADVDSNLLGSIKVVAVDPVTLTTTDIRGRAFIGGTSYGPGLDPDNLSEFQLTTWVALGGGDIQAQIAEAIGFPGTQGGFAGDDVLVDPRTFVFVPDADGNLATPETFPVGQIQMRINESVASVSGRTLDQVGLASSTVGPDTTPPEVLEAGGVPVIFPPDREPNVDPETNIQITFTEPIQVLTLGDLDDGTVPAMSAAVQIMFGPSAARVEVPFFVRPFSVFDLSRLELVPTYNFPGSGPQAQGIPCSDFSTVSVTVNRNQFKDLTGRVNADNRSSEFYTREAPGLVNAPVVPDVIYVGRGGASPGISVIDLYGFGGGTGDPTYDPDNPMTEGNTNFPNNPNVKVQGSQLIPPLNPGTCTFNGGSEGAFTLTKDSSLNDLVARSPLVESVGDMAIGHALDNTFNNASRFGCQSGGGNICAFTGLKRIQLSAGGTNSLAPSTTTTLPVKIVTGSENLVIFAPHPNPPPLIFPPLCLSPLINGQEPTSVQTLSLPTSIPPAPAGPGLTNLLGPGSNSRGNPPLQPPTTILASNQNSYFDGPTRQQSSLQSCLIYSTRQQIGHFLYVVDRAASEIVVFNSNRFTVIDRIRLPDPTSLAMSPNLDLLAVTNEDADQVSFIDTDPASATFHKVVRTVPVGVGPTGIAWDPGNEDIFVCNQGGGTVTILSAFTLRVRKTLRNQINQPIDVAITPRQLGFGFLRGVYFAYILNQDGSLAFFESGPDGANGWGFDDTVGTLPFNFSQPKTLQPDITRLNSAVWVLHENPLDSQGLPSGRPGGALTNVGISSATRGIITILPGSANPSIRNIEFGVFGSLGEGPSGLSGIPVDLAFDNMSNVTPLTNFSSQFSAGQPLSINGKSLVRFNGAQMISASFPLYMFLAVPNPGVIDVLELSTGTVQRIDSNVFRPGIQSIPAANANVVVDFMRQ